MATKVDIDERFLTLAKKVRECFPTGKMFGTPYYYRCNNREVALKLVKFTEQYGEYTDEEIVDATRRFVASFNGTYRYLPLAKYFIIKNKTVEDEDGSSHVVETSKLADFLENKEDTTIETNDWLSNTRN